MGENTHIEWAHHTFNPWYGCQKVGPGCDHCYAEGWAKRSGLVQWGPVAERRRSTPANWRMPLKWNADAQALGIRYRVFCASLADVFDNQVPPEWRRDLFSLIAQTPHLDWLLVTKRVGNVMPMCSRDDLIFDLLTRRVWLGITVCNQAEADRDIPKLLATPAAVRFLSVEPLLGPIKLAACWLSQACGVDKYSDTKSLSRCFSCSQAIKPYCATPDERLNWVIVGGESGHQARPMHPNWVRSLRNQCAGADVPFLFKQWGEWIPVCEGGSDLEDSLYRSRRIAKENEAQADLDEIWGRDCIVPHGVIHNDGKLLGNFDDGAWAQGSGAMLVFKTGKKAAGRLLDGLQHDAFPVLAGSI